MAHTYTPQIHNSGPVIESREEYVEESTPGAGPSRYWQDEIKASLYMLRRWHRQADIVSQRYLDQRVSETSVVRGHGHSGTTHPGGRFRLNLFYSNITTQLNLLYGRLPQVDVRRRFNDARDDTGRVAATLLERVLNNDVQDHEEEYDSVLKAVLEDRLVPGAGIARVRYEVETEDVEIAATVGLDGQELGAARVETRVKDESAPVDYFHWRDVTWPWARTWADLRWVGFRSFVTKKEWEERFPGVSHDNVEFKQQQLTSDNEASSPELPELNDNWLKAEVWEIWDRATRTVVWVCMTCDTLLDQRDDPLNLSNFFPCPRFLVANPSTSLFIPTPDFHLAQDLYNEIDKLQTRIAIITEAVKVVGVYDSSTPEVQRMLKEGIENDLIPVDKWALFAEKGGLQGQIDWFPIEEVVGALINLRQLRDETIALLYQVTGMSDILRGQLDNQYEGVGQSRDKVMFGSIRIQGVQEQFATFVSDLMLIKAEIVCKHFDPETIARYSNAEALFDDPQAVTAALELLKSPEQAKFKVKVEADSLAQVDYQRTQAERTEFLTAISAFLQAAAPMTEQEPATAPFLLQLLQWGLSGFRGADEIEGVVDRAIEATVQAQQSPKPDPETARMQAQAQLEQAKAQGQLQIIQAKTQAALQERQADLYADVQTAQAQHQMEMAQQEAELRREIAQIEAKARADMAVETHQSAVNAAQQRAAVEGEIQKDVIEHRLELESIAAETAKSIAEARVNAAVKQIPTPSTGDSSGSDSD